MVLFYFLFWMAFSAIVYRFQLMPDTEEYPLAVFSAGLICCMFGALITTFIFKMNLLEPFSFTVYCLSTIFAFFTINFIVIKLESFLGNLWGKE